MRYETLPLTQEELFMRHVYPEPNTGCWLWGAYVNPTTGYGQYWPRKAPQTSTAHRVSWLLFRGPIPEGLQIDHLCRVRSCVNPDHLEPVTLQENLRRGIGSPRKTHCIRGHAFTPENTYTWASQKKDNRSCRRCHAEYMRQYRKKRARAG